MAVDWWFAEDRHSSGDDGRATASANRSKDQVMAMAQARGEFLAANLRYPNGQPVECVIADSCIGGVAEAAACADKFQRAGVGLSLTVTPCWCYGSETMDMDPLMPKRSGASTAPSARRGLSGRRARRPQPEGLPAFGIYGRDVQDRGDETIPPTCRPNSCASPRPASPPRSCAASPTSRSAAPQWASPARSWTSRSFESFLGMRVEAMDMSEIMRRVEENIFDQAEFKKGPRVGQAELQGRPGLQPAQGSGHRGGKDQWWAMVVKMTMIARDLMIGNPNLDANMARKRSAITRSSAASKASAPGPITSRTATSWRRCSTPRSIGMASARPT